MVGFCDVTGKGGQPGAAVSIGDAQLAGEEVEPVLASGGNDNMPAAGEEFGCQGLSKPCGCAGDDCGRHGIRLLDDVDRRPCDGLATIIEVEVKFRSR
jgi:hypothetical protein